MRIRPRRAAIGGPDWLQFGPQLSRTGAELSEARAGSLGAVSFQNGRRCGRRGRSSRPCVSLSRDRHAWLICVGISRDCRLASFGPVLVITVAEYAVGG